MCSFVRPSPLQRCEDTRAFACGPEKKQHFTFPAAVRPGDNNSSDASYPAL